MTLIQIASAFCTVLFKIIILEASSCENFSASVDTTPPAPKIIIFLPFTLNPFCPKFKEVIKPFASVLYPYNLLSFIFTVLTAPNNSASLSIPSRYGIMSTLCGIVRLNPVTLFFIAFSIYLSSSFFLTLTFSYS